MINSKDKITTKPHETPRLAHASQLLAIGTMAEVPLGSRMLSRDGPLATEVVWELHP